MDQVSTAMHQTTNIASWLSTQMAYLRQRKRSQFGKLFQHNTLNKLDWKIISHLCRLTFSCDSLMPFSSPTILLLMTRTPGNQTRQSSCIQDSVPSPALTWGGQRGSLGGQLEYPAGPTIIPSGGRSWRLITLDAEGLADSRSDALRPTRFWTARNGAFVRLW